MEPGGLAGLSVLVVEDDLLLRRQITALLEGLRIDVTGTASVGEARRLAAELTFDFVLLDIHLPDGSGMDLLQDRVFGPAAGVLVMTADGGVAGAVEAMRLGAADYLAKPFDVGELPLALGRLRRGRQRARIEEQYRSNTASAFGAFFFGTSLAGLERMLARILEADARIGRHLPPVLIQGETGTGKTTIARWLHHQGPRASGPLVEMNCSALPETLAESELFGHEKGAFTDARATRIGLFEAADGGTLFLDELPSLSLGLQAKVLTALEDHRIRRVGGRREIEVDVRVVAASSQPLRALAAAGEFREDLMHRLDLYRVVLPPLRERGEDLAELAELLVQGLCRRHRLPQRRLGSLGLRRLRSYSWPGNVRELSHELERSLVFEDGPDLELSQMGGGPAPMTGQTDSQGWFNPAYAFPAQGFSLEEAIQTLIAHALKQTGDNVSAAARLLGVSRDYLRYRLAGKRGAAEAGLQLPTAGKVGGTDPGHRAADEV
jgi:two-component system, NtrC family, response regulator AtoC